MYRSNNNDLERNDDRTSSSLSRDLGTISPLLTRQNSSTASFLSELSRAQSNASLNSASTPPPAPLYSESPDSFISDLESSTKISLKKASEQYDNWEFTESYEERLKLFCRTQFIDGRKKELENLANMEEHNDAPQSPSFIPFKGFNSSQG